MNCPKCKNGFTKLKDAKIISRTDVWTGKHSLRLAITINCEECGRDYRTEINTPSQTKLRDIIAYMNQQIQD